MGILYNIINWLIYNTIGKYMGKLFTPQDISSGFNTTNSLNTNFDNIETALDRTLSRYGEAPNAMEATLDMNDNAIINAGAVDCSSITIDGLEIASVADLAAEADRAEAAATAAELAETNAETAQGLAEAAQAAAELAAASVDLPVIAPGDAGKTLLVNGTEDGYEYSTLPTDPDTAITARLASQAEAEAGADNTKLMTPLRTKEAFVFRTRSSDALATTDFVGDVKLATNTEARAAWDVDAIDPGAVNEVLTIGALQNIMSGRAIGQAGNQGRLAIGELDIRWGRTARTGTSTTVTFEDTFPNVGFGTDCQFVVAQSEDDGGTRSLQQTPNVNSISATGFNARHGTDFTHIRWLAIGRS